MQDRPTERVRVLLDGLTASAIVDRVHPYYSGYQFEGEWLDTLKESIEGELDDLDRIIRGRAGTVGAVDRLREYVANAPASSMGEMARAIVRNYCDTIEVEAKANRVDAYTEGYDAGFASADDWAAQHEDAMAEHGWVRLPVDADGVPIHVGETVTCVLPFGGESEPFVVDRMELGRDGDGDVWGVALDRPTSCWEQPLLLRHHHAPTVEDVLREFAANIADVLGGDDFKLDDNDELYAEFAKRLRLAEEVDA